MTSRHAPFSSTVCLSKHPAAAASFNTQKMAEILQRQVLVPLWNPDSEVVRQNSKTDATALSVYESSIVPR